MNEPRLPITTVEAQRVLRLADALNSLKARPAPRARPARVDEQRTDGSQTEHAPAVRRAKRAAVTSPAVPRRAPTRRASYAAPLTLPELSAFKRSPTYLPKDGKIWSSQGTIQEFCGDRELIERLGVAAEEIKILSGMSMMGNLTFKQDVLFILREIRAGRGIVLSSAAFSPGALQVPYQPIEPSTPNIGEMVAWIRGEALAKLSEWESTRRMRSRGLLGQLEFLASIKTILSWRHQPSPG